MDNHKKTLAKTLSWRVIATLTTITIVYTFTGKWALSLGVGAVEVVTKLIFYYFHERAWNKITFGGKKNE